MNHYHMSGMKAEIAYRQEAVKRTYSTVSKENGLILIAVKKLQKGVSTFFKSRRNSRSTVSSKIC
ncbi:hypothetical protein [Evansella tamaricis]|uniref:Uncharacterized protein n=1 Tax=Evansella tamaricis TaxID=2069301 RepID=A0ABS6JH35_9BACI|nr:hypothetical protein [Evansella tamaricis]MBU9712539.1 hypothetical protein [Evansella tamaricis]